MEVNRNRTRGSGLERSLRKGKRDPLWNRPGRYCSHLRSHGSAFIFMSSSPTTNLSLPSPTEGRHKHRKRPFIFHRENQRLWETLEVLIGRDRDSSQPQQMRILLCGFDLFNICVSRTEEAKPDNNLEASEQPAGGHCQG